MASGGGKVNGKTDYLSPIPAVKDFFDSLSSLKALSRPGAQENGSVIETYERVYGYGERVVKCLDHQMRQQNRASETAQEMIGAFQLGIRRLVQLKGEVEDLKKVIKELHLADQGLDSRSIGPFPSSATSTMSSATSTMSSTTSSLQGKHGGILPGSNPIPRASSYEDFMRHRDLMLNSSKKAESSTGGSSIRKAKSESDVAVLGLQKKVESLNIDNNRLKISEKTLIKKNIKLVRNVKALEKERDVAEDRLKIEQTQRDSIEKLRQRNKELEQQLRELCDSQVIREREAAKAQETSANPQDQEGEGDTTASSNSQENTEENQEGPSSATA